MNSNYHPSSVDLEPSYTTYSPYTDYPTPTKLEALEYNYWPTAHNLIDQIQTPILTNETLVPNLSQINSSTTISSTHHHHHIHQHVYPTNDSPNWITPTDYQTPPPTYRHYTYPNNQFYDQSQWSTPAIKYEPPYSPPSYYENIDQPLSDSKEEPSDSSYIKCSEEQSNYFKSQLTPAPPKNPTNGKTRTCEKYRIVYTDRQRYELENEFSISKYISIPRKAALSASLGLSERQIKIWFQNRRAKERKITKKRQNVSSRQLNNSTDADSASDGDLESPIYYQNYV